MECRFPLLDPRWEGRVGEEWIYQMLRISITKCSSEGISQNCQPKKFEKMLSKKISNSYIKRIKTEYLNDYHEIFFSKDIGWICCHWSVAVDSCQSSLPPCGPDLADSKLVQKLAGLPPGGTVCVEGGQAVQDR